MSRARNTGRTVRAIAEEEGLVTSPGVAALVTGNSPHATPASVIVSEADLTLGPVNRIDPRDGEIAQLRGDLNAARIAVADANRLMDQLKIQRTAAMDEIMLLRAQLKVAVEDGNAGWAAASAARGPTH